MQVIRSLDHDFPCRGGVVSIGNFDGVHRGHQAMLRKLVSLAHQRDVPATAMTFDPPPVALIAPEKVPPRLSTVERKAELMEKLGVDCLLVYPTNREFLNLSPEAFFQKIVLQELQACGLVEGPNFFFGKDRSGDVRLLEQMAREEKLAFEVVPAVESDTGVISSSLIRRLIANGEVEEAVTLLGHPYRMTGRVEPGASRGNELGFPTANLGEVETLIPSAGVYAGIARIGGERYAAALNIGSNPTFADEDFKLEVHLLDFERNLYGQELSVDFLASVREIRKFDSPEDLQKQVQQDVTKVRQIVADFKASAY